MRQSRVTWLPEFWLGHPNVSALLLDLLKVYYLTLVKFYVNLVNI